MQTWKLTRIAVLTALASILFLLEIPIVAFYKLDFSTFPAILAGFSMGPAAGLIVVALKSGLHLLRTTTSGVGELADLLVSGALVWTASVFYLRHKSLKQALLGLLVGIVAMTVMGALANYFVLIPFYSQFMPMESILGLAQKAVPSVDSVFTLVLYITTPFNLFKGAMLGLVTLLVYKRVSPLLHRTANA